MREGERKDRGSMTEEMGRKREGREEDLIGRERRKMRGGIKRRNGKRGFENRCCVLSLLYLSHSIIQSPDDPQTVAVVICTTE